MTPASTPTEARASAEALAHALARDEAAGRRPPRLTEPGLATWNRFRGRLTKTQLLGILFEDAAVLHAVPFDASVVGAPPSSALPPDVADAVCEAALAAVSIPSAEYVAAQARRLALPANLSLTNLPALQPHQKVLELPGTGGQAAHHLASTQPGLAIQDNFTIGCATWQELTLAGVVALDLGAPHTRFVEKADLASLRDPEHPIRKRSFDVVVGLDPKKGGAFVVEDQLAIWFPHAKVFWV